MNTIRRVARYEASNVLRSRWVITYALFFLAATEGLLRFTGGSDRALLSVASIVLFVAPLVTIVYGTVYLYGAREFTELLLAQPVRRWHVFAGLYLGLSVPLSAALAAGVALPFAFHGVDDPAARGSLLLLVLAGVALTGIFTAFAFLIALHFEDRLRGLGAAIGLWLVLGLFYDGLVLFLAALLADHPMEKPILALVLANPLDLARVLLLLRFDIAALMGYTGAVFQRFFAGGAGMAASGAALVLWLAAPLVLGARAFRRKDF